MTPLLYGTNIGVNPPKAWFLVGGVFKLSHMTCQVTTDEPPLLVPGRWHQHGMLQWFSGQYLEDRHGGFINGGTPKCLVNMGYMGDLRMISGISSSKIGGFLDI